MTECALSEGNLSDVFSGYAIYGTEWFWKDSPLPQDTLLFKAAFCGDEQDQGFPTCTPQPDVT